MPKILYNPKIIVPWKDAFTESIFDKKKRKKEKTSGTYVYNMKL